jgi:uncharacterized protein YqcC (DUF446 family)
MNTLSGNMPLQYQSVRYLHALFVWQQAPKISKCALCTCPVCLATGPSSNKVCVIYMPCLSGNRPLQYQSVRYLHAHIHWQQATPVSECALSTCPVCLATDRSSIKVCVIYMPTLTGNRPLQYQSVRYLHAHIHWQQAPPVTKWHYLHGHIVWQQAPPISKCALSTCSHSLATGPSSIKVCVIYMVTLSGNRTLQYKSVCYLQSQFVWQQAAPVSKCVLSTISVCVVTGHSSIRVCVIYMPSLSGNRPLQYQRVNYLHAYFVWKQDAPVSECALSTCPLCLATCRSSIKVWVIYMPTLSGNRTLQYQSVRYLHAHFVWQQAAPVSKCALSTCPLCLATGPSSIKVCFIYYLPNHHLLNDAVNCAECGWSISD